MTKTEARRRLRESGVLPTSARMTVLRLLVSSRAPLSMREIQLHFLETDWHRTTITRSIATLREVGLVVMTGQRGDVDTYVVAPRTGLRRSPHLCRCTAVAVVTPPRVDRTPRAASDSARSASLPVCPVCHPE